MKKAEFKKIVKNYIDYEKGLIAEHEAIKAILLPLEGKPITSRVLNPTRLGKFEFVSKYGMFYIVGEHEHLIGYRRSENLIAVNETDYSRGFEHFAASSGSAARKRIAKVEGADLGKAFKLFSKLAKTYNELKYIFNDLEAEKLGSFDFPPYYDMLRGIAEESDEKHVKLTNFWYIMKKRP